MVIVRAVLFISLGTFAVFGNAVADYPGKPMSDNEIRDLIIKGTLNDFEKGMCYQKTEIDTNPATNNNQTDNGVNTQSRSFNYNSGTFWPTYSYQITNQTQERKPAPEPKPILQCYCACPYSLNFKNQPCGESSAYFQYPTQFRPKCYREDIQDWEVNDFRNLNEIPKNP